MEHLGLWQEGGKQERSALLTEMPSMSADLPWDPSQYVIQMYIQTQNT